jgi:hypothetical protein
METLRGMMEDMESGWKKGEENKKEMIEMAKFIIK